MSDKDPPSVDESVDDKSAHENDKAVVDAARKAAATGIRRALRKPRPPKPPTPVSFWSIFGSSNHILLLIIVIGLLICMVAGAVTAALRDNWQAFGDVMKVTGALVSPIVAYIFGRATRERE